MTLNEKLTAHRDEILAIAARYGARNVRVFGSVARGEANEESDVDFLVTLDEERTAFDVGGLAYDLMALLGCEIDVATDDGLRGRFRERVLRDAVALEEIAA